MLNTISSSAPLQPLRIYNEHVQEQMIAIERLSTGLRINRASDDPSGLIASEMLRADSAALAAAIENAQRGKHVLRIADGGLNEISNLLVEAASLVVESANDAALTTEEKEANQLQLESIFDGIDHIVNSKTFQGKKLLNGEFESARFHVSPDFSEGYTSVGLPDVSASTLGFDLLRSSGDANLIDGDISKAQDIIDAASTRISKLRAHIGAFEKHTLDTSIRSMQVTLENTLAAESAIRDTDFAKEVANLNRSQILAQAGLQVIAISNAQAQSVLQLIKPL